MRKNRIYMSMSTIRRNSATLRKATIYDMITECNNHDMNPGFIGINKNSRIQLGSCYAVHRMLLLID
uniref:Uncharacterized protein n=1 Tax=Onchocerca volvulus TaxID=6282 RepID=A0A8R1TSV8_ONCVO